MEGMLKTATMIERSRKRPLPARILPTLFDRRTRACTETLDLLREQHPDRTWVQAVPLDTRLRDAAELTHAELSHEVTQSRGFDAYQRALAWLLREAPQPQEQPA
jgi:chromosome partitioning protein